MPETRHRVVTETRKNNEAPLRFDASLSSEYAYLRGYGYEVLSHEPDAINMERAADGLPLLVQHDHDRPVGMVENIRIMGRKLRASIRFFSTSAGREAATMVEEGLRALSIGYQVDSTQQTGARDGVPVFKVDRWTPFECSLVSVPADPSVGIGRSAKPISQGKIMIEETLPAAEERAASQKPAVAINEIIAIGQMFAKRGGEKLALEAIQVGTTVEQFRQQMLRHGASQPVPTSDVGQVYRGKREEYSLRNLILSAVEPAKYGNLGGYEREHSVEIERRDSMRAHGTFVPESILRRDLATTVNGGASLIEDTLRPDMTLRVVRPQARVIEAGARVLSGLTGDLRIPRQTAGAVASWKAEQALADETNVTFADLELTPKRLTTFIDVSRQQLIQGSLDIEQMLRDDLARAADQLIDYAAINGTGLSGQPRGIRSTSGIGSVAGGTNGAQFSWAHIVDLESAVASTDVDMARPGYLANAATRAWLRKTPRGTDMDYILEGKVRDEPLNSCPLYISNNVPKDLTKGTSVGVCSSLIFSGDWSELIIARFGEMDIVVDPYSFATTATIRITINQFLDIAVRQPKAFAIMEDGLTA